MLVTLKDTNPYRMTLFYSYVDRSERSKFFTQLRQLASQSSLPRVVLDDFKELLAESKEKGLLSHPKRLIMDFQAALEECGLQGLVFLGHLFT